MVGLDIGTMNLIAASNDPDGNTVYKSIRNAFVKVDPVVADTLDLSKITHTVVDGETYILGSDAYNMANVFGESVRRPMKDGLLAPDEIDAVDVLGILIRNILPKPSSLTDDKDSKPRCTFSCPAESLDAENSVTYHREVLKRVIESAGFTPEPVNEALAIVYSNCADTGFTGIAVSFGAGMTNVALAYKAVPIFTFSLKRGGDWIDNQASLATGVTPSRVCAIKEKPDFDINNWQRGKKRERMVREALSHYYKELITYTCHNIAKKLASLDDVDLPDEVPVILSGGTSLIEGFTDMASGIIAGYCDDYPFDVAAVRSADDRLNAVAQGCLIRSLT